VPFNVALGLVKKRVSFVDLTPAEFADPLSWAALAHANVSTGYGQQERCNSNEPLEQVWGQAHAIAVAGGSFRGP
jgi:hypothetical protein